MARSWPVTFEPSLDSKYFSFLINRIDSLAATLRDLPLAPSVRAAVDRRGVIKAIRGTCGIEGNGLGEADIERLLARSDLTAQTAEERQILNTDLALRQIRKRKPLPLAELVENNIKDLHDLVTMGVDYLDQAPGEYRTSDLIVGSYACPRAVDVPTLMALLTNYMNTRSVMISHPIVRALLAHFYLLSIHPFADGNGRATRAVEAYLLYHGGYGNVGFYALADYYFQNREEYAQELDRARFEHNGELRDWVIFGLEGFLAELEERQRWTFATLKTAAFIQHLSDLTSRNIIPRRVASIAGRLAAEPHGLTIALFKSRNIPWLADAYRGLTDRSVRNDLTIMRKLGLISESDGGLEVSYKALEARS